MCVPEKSAGKSQVLAHDGRRKFKAKIEFAPGEDQ